MSTSTTYSGPNRTIKRCRYCKSETCRSSAWTTSGWDIERFERLHRSTEILETMTCFECGFESEDTGRFVVVNVEPASYSMRDPYPGYAGDPLCLECAGEGE